MSSPNRSTFDIEDAFSSMNILNYTLVSSNYFPASSGSSSFNSSENSKDNMILPVIEQYTARSGMDSKMAELVPTLISQAPGPSRKRSRSPSLPFLQDAITFSDGKPASETSGLNPEDVTARLEDIEVEIDTLHADTEDKELLISELQDSLESSENEIAILKIRIADAEDRHC
ncbi:hypothetical protein Tco_0521171 [Tanacetum coccineum]